MLSKIFYSLLMICSLSFFCVACLSSEKKLDKTNNHSQKTINSPVSFPPGTASVFVTILNLKTTEKNKSYIARIDTVYGYGSSTPPLSIGSEIELTISSISFPNDMERVSKDFKSETGHKLNLSFRGKKLGQERANKWQIIKIIN